MAQEEEVVVWEWFSDHGRWKAYDPQIVNAIEANSSSGTRFGLGEVDPSLSAYAIDFSSNRQIRLNTGKVRPIRRSTFPASSAPGKGIQWQWLDDTGWSSYDLSAGNIVEEAYAHGKSSLDLSQTNCHLPYVVDFTSMEQTRKGTGFQRKVQRISLNPCYPKVQSAAADNSDDDDGGSLSGPSVDGPVTTVTSSSAAAATAGGAGSSSVVICIEKTAPATVTRPSALVSSTSAVISDEVGTTESPTSGTNPLLLLPTELVQAKRATGKRTGSRKAVAAATSGVQATVAWSTPPGSSSGASSTTVLTSAGSGLPRSSSVPMGIGPEVTTTAGLTSTLSSSSSSSSSGPTISHSATTSCLAAAAAAPSRMTRSQSTPCNITAKPAHAAGAKLSPIMTVPIKLSPTPIPVFTPPPTSRGGIRPVEGVKPSRKKRKTSFSKVDNAEDVLKNYVNKVKKPPDEDCPICYEKLGDTSHFSEETSGEDPILRLQTCNHMFHQSCLHAMYNSGPKDGSIQCPTCKKIYGVKHGNQPPGRMDYHVIPHSLPAYDDCGTIRIIYDIPPGTQGEEHPHPGKRYSSRGFPRHCYLPDNPIGQKILKLLVIAWERRLIFTIGTSATTGEPNTVVWNEIHHKTEFGSNVTGHGFPDPNYFDNILSELSSQGVTEDCLDT
ncbi:E3 ubiquitin-protein ligase DTX4-like isoform X2 [Amphiura filiformis]|uniref:E3 ubiquitin-protein ligase DTX4-like isoform X2 n=1 Tax=Amphiura filiformis TaxID=82378 RepID=UPI003B21F8C3